MAIAAHLLILSLVAGGVTAATAHAQSALRGRVVDERSGAPVDNVTVTLLSTELDELRTTITDSTGHFIFAGLQPRRLRLRARRIGLQPVTTPAMTLAQNEVLVVELRMARNEVLLAPVEIVARTPMISPILQDFEIRRRRGFGHFLTRADVEQRAAFQASDLLMMVPGVRLSAPTSRSGARVVYMTRAPAWRNCPALIYVDGFLVNRSMSVLAAATDSLRAGDGDRGGVEFTLDEIVSPSAIEGIEIYRGLSEVPAEFAGPNAECGVVAVWTKRGGGDPP